jgi:hypothetical protein
MAIGRKNKVQIKPELPALNVEQLKGYGDLVDRVAASWQAVMRMLGELTKSR